MTELTYDTAVNLLERAVAEHGADFIYPDSEREPWQEDRDDVCSYYVEDNGGYRPSCIIGMVIDYLGLREQFLAERENWEGTPGVRVLESLGVTFDAQTRHLLDEAQTQQDRGETWGDAVELATSIAIDA